MSIIYSSVNKIFFIWILFSVELNAIDIQVDLISANTNYCIGDKISLKYLIKYDRHLTLIVPDFNDIDCELEFLDCKLNDDSSTLQANFIVFKEGEYILPHIVFTFEDIKTKRFFTKQSPTYRVKINNIQIDSQQNSFVNIKEIPYQNIKEGRWNYIAIVAAGILIFILILIIFRRIKKATQT